MSAANDEWYCRVGGQVEGPLSARALKMKAALGEMLPTDEVRWGLDGKWQLAKTISGLHFSTASTRQTPVPAATVEAATSVNARAYRYKMVQIPPTILIREKVPKSQAAAVFLESLVNEEAADGWEFYRIDTIGSRVQAGCLSALLGLHNVTESYYVVTFRKAK